MSRSLDVGRGLVSIVDDEDYEWICRHSWRAGRTSKGVPYVRRNFYLDGAYKTVYLHRAIAKAPPGLQVDHANWDTLDNRRSNLRVCTQSQNNANSWRSKPPASGFRGVYAITKRVDLYEAVINLNGKAIRLGRFVRPEDAAVAYDAKAIELYGEFARTNFQRA